MSRFRHLLALLALGLASTAAHAADPGQVIFPGGTNAPGGAAGSSAGAGAGPLTIAGIVLLAGAGGWMLWRSRKLGFSARDTRRLVIDETRSLGSRQYLVVASYEGQKLLLGVCPGRIDLLTPLDAAATREKLP